jgi:uncharacterized membrane protein HdeD (DUF308 family)
MVAARLVRHAEVMNDHSRTPLDASTPTLLMVCLSAVLVAVAGVVAIGQTSATAALFAGVVVVLAGTAAVTFAIGRQLDDADGEQHESRRERVTQ